MGFYLTRKLCILMRSHFDSPFYAGAILEMMISCPYLSGMTVMRFHGQRGER